MVIPRHHTAILATRSLLVVVIVVFFCQCTTRTVTVRQSTVSFADDNDEDELRNKFAEKGYSIGDDGSIVADKPDLYAGRTPRGLEGEVGTKMAKLGKKDQSLKELKTPEYLKIQEFRGTRNAANFDRAASESDPSRSQFRSGRRLFETETKEPNQFRKFAEKITGNSKQESSFAEKVYDESVVSNAAVAQGIDQKIGYRPNAGMTVDDVKKMLNPNVYADRQGL